MRLSVIVTIVDQGVALERCLESLLAQRGAPALEIIVPVDDFVADLDALRAAHEGRVRFVRSDAAPTAHLPRSAAGQHELFDRRRAAGLAAATGDLVAIVEDRGVPRANWASAAVAAHADGGAAAIGGPICCARDGALALAVFLCDFAPYEPPLEDGLAATLSDVNVCYARRALDQVRASWRDEFHEPVVHAALRARGDRFRIASGMIVDQMRDGLTLTGLITERFHWGRLYAATRCSITPGWKRAALVLASPLLPGLLFARIVVGRVRRRAASPGLVHACPALVVLLCAWSVGELTGYVTARR